PVTRQYPSLLQLVPYQLVFAQQSTEPAASRDVTTFFQLAQEDSWENVNFTSLSCEDRKNRTWITLQLTSSTLTTFPACLPEALETLDLSNNLLEEVNGTELASLPRLRVLLLRQNLLRAVRWGPEALGSLLFLDLSFNKLSSVPSCHASFLPSLRWLSLAGNPLVEIQPLAFSCYPQLQFLNLSTTLLGQDDRRGIGESAFAISTSPSEATNRTGNTINVLDLSGTFLEKSKSWTKDLPSLRELHLTKMSRLRSLDTDLRSMPHLRELNCDDSHSLGFVRTEMFESTPRLSHLSFQNCNLSSFNPWNITSSDSIVINLHGNPLPCDCRLSWLLSKPEKVVLQRALDTFCNVSQGNWDRPSTSFSLQELYDECQAERNVTLPHSNTPSTGDEAFSFASYSSTAAATTGSALPTEDTHPGSLTHRNAPSTTAANPAELLLIKASSSSREDEAVSEAASPSSRPTSDYSTTARGHPGAADHFVHSFAVERTPQPELRRLNSTRSGAHSASASTRSLIHYVDDYEYEEQTTEPPVPQVYTSCDYNPCRHLQRPCSELQSVSRCLCPGMSREDEIPDPPRLREVSEVTDSSAQVHWCAPNSVVRTYQLMLHDQGNKERRLVLDNIYATARQYTLYNLRPYTTYHICVTASNKAGASQVTSQGLAGNSCTRFQTKPSYKSVFAALSAASGLFLISTIILSILMKEHHV
uniref:Leucine rich repeat neuronal 4 n=1 Tax=Anas platyrhynchos platyrhynchos TaxID=8840 RepID=U3I621_ANAPP